MRQSRPDRYNRLPHAEEIPCAAFLGYSSCVMQRKPYGAMVSSTDQTPQVPFTFSIIKHYFERPAPSVRLVKTIHLRACHNYRLMRLRRSVCPSVFVNLQRAAHLFEESFWGFFHLSFVAQCCHLWI